MPKEIEKAFQKEYGKKKGILVFYKWRSKNRKSDDRIKKNILKY